MNSVTRLSVPTISCQHCAGKIESHLAGKGIGGFSVDVPEAVVWVRADASHTLPQIQEALKEIGYRSSVVESDEVGALKAREAFAENLLVLVCILLTAPLLLGHFGVMPLMAGPWWQLGLSLPVVVIGLCRFGASAWGALCSFSPNMELLITTGALVSFFYSLFALISGSHRFLFFETAASLITIVLIGSYLERRAVRRTQSLLTELLERTPTLAKRVTKDGSLEEVPTEVLGVGDEVAINLGDQVPADGKVTHGEGYLDESFLTGEAFPVFRNVGEEVLAGTILEEGSLRLQVTSRLEHSVFSQVLGLIRAAKDSRPAIQRAGDEVARYFVPAVVALAIVTFGLWWLIGAAPLPVALLTGISVLVIACPCAVGLATPTAVMVGVGAGAKRGIVIKGGDIIERLKGIKTVVFDKTGTLTTGQFGTPQITTLAELGEDRIISLLVSLERHSTHPLAKSIVTAYPQVPFAELADVRETRGAGVGALTQGGDQLWAGSYSSVAHLGAEKGHLIYLTINDELVAHLDMQDAPRPHAKECIRLLRDQGIETVLISGDEDTRCHALASLVGIDKVHSECSPEKKLSLLKEYQQQQPTAFVGDGINDAPSLAAAYVGIALHGASASALAAAHVVLLRDDLRLVLDAIDLSKKSYRTITTNLFWAFFYNVLAIPVAAFGYLTPTIAAAAMGLSDLVVVGNSLWLRMKLSRARNE